MIQILIIADDETGMLDTGAQFAQKGIRTEAMIQKPTVEAFRQSEAEVAVVNTGTRHASAEEAYQKVYEISETALKAGIRILYKKTDSALRGQIGAELKALMDAAEDSLYFFPAYPDAGRITVKGVQYVDGIPVGDSIFAKDELNPMTKSYIPDILKQTAEVSVELTERAGDWIPGNGKRQITVFDAGSTEELHNTVKDFLGKCTPRLLAGCAGLSHELADMLKLPKSESGRFPPICRIFALCGSSNLITREQMDYAANHGFARFTLKREDMSGKGQLMEIRRACAGGKSIILDMEYLPPETAVELGITKKQLGSLVVDSVNRVLMQCMDMLEDYILFLTGGDTLGRFTELSGCEKIRILGEFSPGIAMNLFYINGKEVYTISKSGGFGDKQILIQLLEGKGGKKYEKEG